MFTDACPCTEQYYGRASRLRAFPNETTWAKQRLSSSHREDSFYSVQSAKWRPYIQHRGGSQGFLRVINETTLVFADYKGNRQLLTTGNVSVNDRVALFLMDYKNRERLKILGHARIEDARAHPELVAEFADLTLRSAWGLVFIDVGHSLELPKYTRHGTRGRGRRYVDPLKLRIAEPKQLQVKS